MVVGCGSGYSAAAMAQLAGKVVAVEEDPALAAMARRMLAEVGAANVSVVEGKLRDGAPAEAPFDAILVDGAVEEVPDSLVAQLKPFGTLTGIERGERISRAVLYERLDSDASRRPMFEAWAALLPGFERPHVFVF
jgi:protein-L-isoaspartate(D-aspartate) O-methyltransferase